MWAAYSTPQGVLRDNGLACIGAGESHEVSRGFHGRTLSCHGLVVITSGNGWYSGASPSRSVLHVHAPALIWLFPGVQHGYGTDPDGWSEHWVLFTGALTTAYRETRLTDPQRPIVRPKAAPEGLTEIFAGLRSSLTAKGLHSQLTASVLVQRLVLAAITSAVSSDSASVADPILDALVASAARAVSISERARELGLTVPALRDRVRAATGLTPQEYLVQVRMTRAQSLLAETEMDVAAIGSRVGYDDPAYFSRLFKSRVGMSASLFRRQQQRRRE